MKSVLHDEKLRCSARVGDICTRKVVVLTPEDNLHTAMALFDAKGLEEIPVVEDADDRWVVGMLRRRDAIAAYNKEVLRRGIGGRSCPLPSVADPGQ